MQLKFEVLTRLSEHIVQKGVIYREYVYILLLQMSTTMTIVKVWLNWFTEDAFWIFNGREIQFDVPLPENKNNWRDISSLDLGVLIYS